MKFSPRSLTTALLALVLTTLAARAGDPSGTWKWVAEGPKGRSADTTLVLSWANHRLSGSIDNRLGKVDIRDATFADDQIAFTVERKIRFRKFTVKYRGKLDGDTITGTAETTGRDKQPISIPWTAQRAG